MNPILLPSARHAPAHEITGRQVLTAFLAFFGIILAVNGVLLWQALATHSGLVANEPYRKGLAYNERIEADERQGALAWTATAVLDGQSGVTIDLADARGQPVSQLALTATLGRPSTVRHDVPLQFTERSRGRYVASASVEPGAWLLALEARASTPAQATDAPIYRLKRRLWLKP